MTHNLLAFAVPFFIGLMAVEFFLARKRGKKFFNFTSSVTNINVGIAERLLDTLITASAFFLYDYLYRHFAIFSIRASWALWLTLLICTDFVWYWYHRLAHEVNLFWAAHIVHHQSEDFNYTVSARITVFQAIIRTGFWCILPVIGFPPHMIVSMLLVHGLYPFFIHTRMIGNLGILEYVLVTPSHHRVHHASNPECLDKNYGDVFIIWDKLFGTFRKEQGEIKYGITTPLRSHSFLWQHFHFLLELFVAVRREKGLSARMRMLLGPPKLVDPSIRTQLEQRMRIGSQEGADTPQLHKYVVVQVAASLITLFLFILLERELSWPVQALITIQILLTLVNCGAILEQRRWVFYLEYSRVVILLLALLYHYPSPLLFWVLCMALLLSRVYLRELKSYYLATVY